MNSEPVFQVSFIELQLWLRDGVRLISEHERVKPPLNATGALEDETNYGAQAVLIRLPEKYSIPVAADGHVPALVDDIESISLSSEGASAEARSRLASLGVPWLPIRYEKDWFIPPQPATPRGLREKAPEPAPETPPNDPKPKRSRSSRKKTSPRTLSTQESLLNQQDASASPSQLSPPAPSGDDVETRVMPS